MTRNREAAVSLFWVGDDEALAKEVPLRREEPYELKEHFGAGMKRTWRLAILQRMKFGASRNDTKVQA